MVGSGYIIFLWTRGKFVSTCGAVSLETVLKYIEGQKGV
jgi:REP element-mobilizing transposase RayT